MESSSLLTMEQLSQNKLQFRILFLQEWHSMHGCCREHVPGMTDDVLSSYVPGMTDDVLSSSVESDAVELELMEDGAGEGISVVEGGATVESIIVRHAVFDQDDCACESYTNSHVPGVTDDVLGCSVGEKLGELVEVELIEDGVGEGVAVVKGQAT